MLCKMINLFQTIFILITMVVFGNIGWKIAWWANLGLLNSLCVVGIISILGVSIILYMIHRCQKAISEFMEIYSPMKVKSNKKKVKKTVVNNPPGNNSHTTFYTTTIPNVNRYGNNTNDDDDDDE